MSTPGYGCEFCAGARPVRWLVTHLVNGETLSLCEEDFPVALIPVMAAMLGTDPDRLYDTIKRFVDREAARQAKQAKAAELAPPRGESDDEPEPSPYDPGPEVDDQGGMSELGPEAPAETAPLS